jgi:hypothetical protein
VTRQETAAKVAWSWEAYAGQLKVPPQRIEVGKRLVDAVTEQIEAHALPWQPVFNKGYVAFHRLGGYKVLIVDLFWNGPVRLAVAVPADPQQLNLVNPYPTLETRWSTGEREWGWVIKTIDQVPDVGPAVEIARAYAPETGPMVVPPIPAP